MPKTSSRAAVAPSPSRIWFAIWVTAILSLAILLAPRIGHAAVAATDADLIGKWITDKNDPASDYTIAAGPSAGALQIMVPPKAVGRKVGETLTLHRVGPGEFATSKTDPIWANFKVTQPRHAKFQMHQEDKRAFGIIYILLEKP
jgi:hypothetical protein